MDCNLFVLSMLQNSPNTAIFVVVQSHSFLVISFFTRKQIRRLMAFCKQPEQCKQRS